MARSIISRQLAERRGVIQQPIVAFLLILELCLLLYLKQKLGAIKQVVFHSMLKMGVVKYVKEVGCVLLR